MYKISHQKIVGPVQSAARILHIDLLCNSAPSWCRHLMEIADSYTFVDAYNPYQIHDALCVRPTIIVFGGGSWNKETQYICNDAIKIYLKNHPDVVSFAYWGDGILDSINNIDTSNINVVFCAFHEAVNKFKKEKKVNAEFAVHPIDTNIFYPDYSIPEIYDWCFVGTAYGNKRQKYVDELKKNFPNCIIKGLGYNPEMPPCNYEETANIFRQSKIIININDDEYSNLDSYFSDRLLLGMCAGKLVLTNKQPGLNHLFKQTVNIDWYESMDELKSKISFYLLNDEMRKNIGIRAGNDSSIYSMKNMIPKFCKTAMKYKRGLYV